jgi:DNA (cytosine-5)-methyltransferase 1
VFERTGTRHGPALGVVAKSIADGDPLTPDRYMPDQLLPPPTSRDHKGRNQRDDDSCLTGALLPTPTVADSRAGGNRGGNSADGYEREQLGDLVALSRFGDYAPAVARWKRVVGRVSPDPTEVSTGWIRDRHRRLHGPHKDLVGMRPSLRRFLRPEQRLAPSFVEYMMGLPEGWVTDVPGIKRNEALKALGNGVVPQQAEAALRHMLAREVATP